ncbi:hypothetical protein JAAARDRAFT_583002 [Jaapia argillacea MUCL 33604]|uniref:Condensation domain-containing protein n=1 Tax=Jaapia argillacea MUCL 33604 TaxID=933084 RepID=A0A067P711_9AGAM|nr:hypothetical protein JAAARDRAFT_583002 [Jaapia argillacea MUCL 33604]
MTSTNPPTFTRHGDTWSRPIWGKEPFFYDFAHYHRGIANFLVHVVVSVPTTSPLANEGAFWERLSVAWAYSTCASPVLLAEADDTASPITINYYKPASRQETIALAEAKLNKLPSTNLETFLEEILTNKSHKLHTAQLWWSRVPASGHNQVSYAIALHSSHIFLDGRGAADLLHIVLNNLTMDPERDAELDWTPNPEMLPPPLVCVKDPGVKVAKETVEECVTKFKADIIGKMNYIIPAKTLTPSSLGTTRRLRFTFSPAESTLLQRSYKLLRVSNNTALQAAVWMAAIDKCPPKDLEEEDGKYHLFSLTNVDCRHLISEEWRKRYQGLAICDSTLSCPLKVVAQPDRKKALLESMKKITDDMSFWMTRQAWIDFTPITAQAQMFGLSKLRGAGLGVKNGLVTNLGVVDKIVSPRYGDKADSEYAFEISDFGCSGRISEPQYFLRAWSFDSQFHLQVNYNDHYYDRETIEAFLESVVGILREMPGLVEPAPVGLEVDEKIASVTCASVV